MGEAPRMRSIVVADPIVPHGKGVVFQTVEIRVNPEQFAETQRLRDAGDLDAIGKMTAAIEFRPATEEEYKQAYG